MIELEQPPKRNAFFPKPTVAVAAVLVVLLTASPSAAIRPPVDVSVPSNVSLAKLGLDLHIATPKYVHAGEDFSVVATVKVQLPGATVVHVIPLPVVGQCTVTDVHYSGAVPLGGGYFLMTSDITIYPMVDAADPPESSNEMDVSMSFGTTQDVVGTCTAGIQAIELVDQLAGVPASVISKVIAVVPMPPTLVNLGQVTTVGGNDVDDEAQVTVPATPPPPAKMPVVVLTSTPKVSLKGTILHTEEGPTVADDGYFEIQQDGNALNSETLSKSGDTKVLSADADLPHEKGKTIDSTYCLYGVYKDGGWWTDDEGPTKTCMTIAATEPSDPKVDVGMLREACAVFGLPTTQLDLLRYQVALEPRARATSLVGAPSAVGGYFMFDKDFGAFCKV